MFLKLIRQSVWQVSSQPDWTINGQTRLISIILQAIFNKIITHNKKWLSDNFQTCQAEESSASHFEH